ncbi:Nucleobase:Cation symporter-2 family [Micromonas commoda]|uniref:Nucleobase:Cation symporter-2 family n=1 Tax=Micromonas commoda (strain RCC299 / NOUM17 / CCMP2709) TaxID=296587 RepID=C1FFR0_MICCC|nr:Nucleobase:Cation symporter-2 family [Micromonas commoda]ACO69125.1 Nucleobase:Cation symporter-2 family [Micromonas commoda]|eukprot:XP_002507867.1 Nucleobase:Cation symporter-2 family [Micromonas commoda]
MALTKEKLIGDYDWGALCLPTVPWAKSTRKMPFFARNDETPFLVAAVMGLQHCFAMIGGLITPPFVVMRFSVAFTDVKLQQYAIAASLILSGIFSIVNCLQFKIPGTPYVLGTGVLSVLGTSFTFLPVFENGISAMRADGTDAEDAYGKMLGTVMVCSFLEIFLSFIPKDKLRRMFPPIVTGVAVMCIGIGLTGTGMKYWGGGTIPPIPAGTVCGGKTCCAAGDVALPFGSPELVGLGFSVFVMLVLVELFGSPMMKNCNVIIALLFGYFVAGLSEKCVGSTCRKFVVDTNIENAESITFLWVKSFKLGFYGPAVFPLLIAFLVTTLETIGDIGAVYDASEESVESEEFDKSIQGGLLSDGVCSFLAALGTGMPNTTFSQNNGVIALTKCASRRAGVACGCWLIFFGVLAKVSGIISSIPDCVIGGMTTFLFVNVFISGLKTVAQVDLTSRRNRMILAISLGVGIGVAIVPGIFADMRASYGTSPFFPGVRDGIVQFLSTPYCVGTVLALLMNAILPPDMEILRKDAPISENKA